MYYSEAVKLGVPWFLLDHGVDDLLPSVKAVAVCRSVGYDAVLYLPIDCPSIFGFGMVFGISFGVDTVGLKQGMLVT